MGKFSRDEGSVVWSKVPIELFSHYEVSNDGRIRLNGKIRKPIKNWQGYMTVALYNHCKCKYFTIHRLVAMAFIPKKGMDLLDVNHKDGNKENNNAENLEWCTRSENLKHAYRLGLRKVSEKQREAARRTGKRTCELNRSKSKVACYKDGVHVKTFLTIHDAYRWLKTTVGGAISLCCKGKKPTYKGYTWRYV